MADLTTPAVQVKEVLITVWTEGPATWLPCHLPGCPKVSKRESMKGLGGLKPGDQSRHSLSRPYHEVVNHSSGRRGTCPQTACHSRGL